jgi:hypothetical protein
VSGLGWLAGGVVAALLLAGCSGDEPAAEPPPLKAPTTSPVATESPTTPEPPVLPAAARKNTKAGAVAFARFYVSLLNYTASTGETRELRHRSSRQCESCMSVAVTVEQIYESGGSINHYGWHVRRYNVTNTGRAGSWLVVLGIRAQPHVVRESASGDSRRLDGGNFTIAVYAHASRSGWVMTRMDRSE